VTPGSEIKFTFVLTLARWKKEALSDQVPGPKRKGYNREAMRNSSFPHCEITMLGEESLTWLKTSFREKSPDLLYPTPGATPESAYTAGRRASAKCLPAESVCPLRS